MQILYISDKTLLVAVSMRSPVDLTSVRELLFLAIIRINFSDQVV